MADEWDEPSKTSSFAEESRSFGKGRGFAPHQNNNNNDGFRVGGQNGFSKDDSSNNDFSNGGSKNNNGFGDENKSGGWQSGGGGFDDDKRSGGGFDGERRGRGGGRGGRGGFRNRDDGGSGGGGGWNDGGGGGFQDDDSRPRRGGRGGGRGGRGGFQNRDNDDESGGGGGGWNDGGGGGFQDDDSRPRRGGRGGGRGGRGGFQNRDNDDESGGGGGGGFQDDDSRPRRGGRGGGRGGRGGFQNRDNDDESGGGGGGWSGGGGFQDDGDSKPRRGGGFDKPAGENGEEDENKPPPVTYIPPEPSTEDSEIFSGVDAGVNFSKYDSIEVKVSGENVPPPVETFDQMGLRTLVFDNLKKSGYTKPTPVQKHAVPIIIGGRDLMACAQTGSGKTAAFLVPIIHTLLEQPTELKLIGGGCEPHCVIISPTRELASQIWEQALKFSKDSIIKCAAAYGGVATMHQGRQVANGCHILVATPGRLNDFVERRRVSFASLRFMVLDEADRMLDMGFLEDVRKMMDHESMVPKGQRQTLMFSATFAANVQTIAAEFLHEYVFLAVGIIGGACSDVEQTFLEVPKYEKRNKLKELVQREDINNFPRTLVFVGMKKTADFVAALLSDNNFPTTSMHGDRTQEQREEALRDFKRGKMPILVATAVAGRGLDIKGVAHVINYDLPPEIDEYVHRIGRTGRVGNRGKATSFFDPETDGALVNDLVRVLSQAGQEIPDWLSAGGGSCAPSRGEKFGGRDVRNFGNDGTYDQSNNLPNTAVDPEPEDEW